jgi:acetolactate synthase I/II/III large subunit
MTNLSEQIIKDLIEKGVNTFFGVQGGACARFIDNIIKYKGRYIPVLNEQSAGFYAHGYYLSTRKTAGIIFTTGPGLTNAITGIASCYYDRIPLVVLTGQVKKKLNIAKKTKTRMVGFQEVPHLDLCNPVSDLTLKIDSSKKYLKMRENFLINLNKKVQVIEVQDDVQREKLKKKLKKININSLKFEKKIISPSILRDIKNSKNPVYIFGAGFSRHKDVNELSKITNKQNISVALTWGGQKAQNFINKKNYIGIFGSHNPGYANEVIEKSDLIIAVGCSLLQHQIGRINSNFAKKANIVFINNDLNECKRAKYQFGKRLSFINFDAKEFIFSIKNITKKKINHNFENKTVYPVSNLVSFFKKIPHNKSVIFSDAGATLSWTYQAANLLKNCAPIYTAFNLHSMGYANCASIGAAIQNNNVFCVIGDGSVPMNIQEFAWLKRYKVKIIILDNQGYGIIRQTQRDYYKSKFYGSDFKNNSSKLPNFNLKKIIESYDIKTRIVNKNQLNGKIVNDFIKSKKSEAIIIKVDYSAEVKTYG